MKKTILNTLLIMALLSCHSKYPFNLGEGYKLDNDGNTDFYIQDFHTNIVINAHVLDYSFDSNFIVVEQKPKELILKDTYTNPEMNLEKRNEIFENSQFLQYWIINKKEESKYSLDSLTMLARYSNVYGPFKKEEYLKKRVELGVPKGLKLKGE